MLFTLTINNRCIRAIKKYFPTIKIIKGRPRHPQSQGMIERSHGPFKEAIQKWMSDNNNPNWTVGAFIVQYNMNRRPSDPRNDTQPYVSYFGLKSTRSIEEEIGSASDSIIIID